MFQFILYDAAGRITQIGEVLQQVDIQLQGPDTPLEGTADPTMQWVDGGVITARVDLDDVPNTLTNAGGWTADGVDVLSYGTALPDPTIVTITCDAPRFTRIDRTTVTDGEVELTATVAGEYTITLTTPDHPQYLDKVITVTAS